MAVGGRRGGMGRSAGDLGPVTRTPESRIDQRPSVVARFPCTEEMWHHASLVGHHMETERTRIVEAAMAILQATPERQLGITVMNKALFYADLCALRDLGGTITRAGYVALPQGPVLNHYERSLVKKLDALRLAEQIRDGWEKPLIVRKELDSFTLLTPDEVGIAQLVARRIHSKTAAWVSEYSHENEAWQLAFRQQTGAPISMTIAMQQVLEEDPWMDTEPDEIFRSVIAAAENETGVPF